MPNNFRVSNDFRENMDVWFEPCVVWEVLAADLSISPVHTAAIGIMSSERNWTPLPKVYKRKRR